MKDTKDPKPEVLGLGYSQADEDRIIGDLLRALPENDNWCVEFGAWDGLYVSNSRQLILESDYSAVLIEPDRARFDDLRANYANNPKVHPVNAFVGYRETDGLDAILSRYSIPLNFDLLSIDVDGMDYHIWKAVSTYRPKIVVIEFNPTIPTEVRFVQPVDPSIQHGASLLSLTELAKEKGYQLARVSPCNAFFVDAQYFSGLHIQDNSPRALRKDESAVTHIFSGYDGTVLMQGLRTLPWHSVPLIEAKTQHLPRFLRKYPSQYSLLEKIAFWALMGVRSPRQVVERVRQRMGSDKS